MIPPLTVVIAKNTRVNNQPSPFSEEKETQGIRVSMSGKMRRTHRPGVEIKLVV
jgi:hypothetical protein